MPGTRMSPERYADLLEKERLFHDLLPEFDKLEQCGEDMTAERELCRSKLEQISNLKKHFKPQGY